MIGLGLSALMMTAHAGPPEGATSVTFSYVVTYDMPSTLDAACLITGLCDCTLTYVGKGSLVRRKGNELLFEGPLEVTDGKCHENLTFWVPPEKSATFHTFLFEETSLTTWVGHADKANSKPLTENIKQSKQIWLDGMAAPNTNGTFTHAESEAGDLGGMSISSTHQFSATFHATP